MGPAKTAVVFIDVCASTMDASIMPVPSRPLKICAAGNPSATTTRTPSLSREFSWFLPEPGNAAELHLGFGLPPQSIGSWQNRNRLGRDFDLCPRRYLSKNTCRRSWN